VYKLNIWVQKMLLEEMTTKAVEDHLKRDTLVVIPVGSTEQHGPANPLGTDFMIAQYVARAACERSNAVCAPTIPIGVSEHHGRFKGTAWISTRLLVELMTEYTLSLATHGFDHFVYVNGHGGNSGALTEVSNDLYFHHDLKAVLVNWWTVVEVEYIKELFPNSNVAHAEAVETSMGLAIHEHLIKMNTVPGIRPSEGWGRQLLGVQLPSYTDDFAQDGVAGSVADISKEAGMELLESVISNVAAFVEAFRDH
jgi:creatinine amidohydrolase